MRTAFAVLLALALTGIAHAGPDSFPYATWTNKAGNTFEARFDHLDGDKVVLRAKQGGRRYPVKRDTLSAASGKLLNSYQAEASKKLKALKKDPTAPVPVELTYRAVALGMAGRLRAFQPHRSVRFTIDKIRVKDRLTAILELDGHCIRLLSAPQGREFFLQNDDLYTRPARKDRRYPYPKRMNADARLVHERGSACSVRLGPGLNASWDNIGVNACPVFR